MLAYVAKNPNSTARAISSALNITERTVQKIIGDLVTEEYIERRKVGRNNEYHINPNTKLRHEVAHDVMMQDFLAMLGWDRRR